MPSLASRYARRSLIGALALSGCASIQPTPRRMSAADRYFQIRDSVAAANGSSEDAALSAPRIRLVVPPATYASTRYVDASFHLSDDAYVLVVAVDLDRRLRVLYPESPDESGFAAQRDAHRLSRFFAGFGVPALGSYSRYNASYDISQRISPISGGGVLLAVASDRPLQLDRLVGQDGDWDERLLGQIVFEQSLPSAAHALGRAIALTGQDFSTDFTTFNGQRTLGAYSSFASSSFGECGSGFGYESAYLADGYGFDELGYSGLPTRFVGFYQRDGVRFARYATGGSPCSSPRYYDVPVFTPSPTPRDTMQHDTVSQGRRPPRYPGAPRFPSVTDGSGLAHRLAPSMAHNGAHERPVVSAGIRFRPPERIPTDAVQPFGRLRTQDDAAFPPRRAEPPVERQAPERRAEPRSEPQPAPVRAEPVRAEPVRAEPARSEPVSREPVHPVSAPINPR